MTDPKLKELAELYGIKIHEVPPGKGGLYVGNKRIPPEEVFEFLFGENINEVQNYEAGNAAERKDYCNEK